MKFKAEYYYYIIIAIVVIVLLYIVGTFAKSAIKAAKDRIQAEADKAAGIIKGQKRTLTDAEAQEVANRIDRYLNSGFGFDKEAEAAQEIRRVKNMLDYIAVKEAYGTRQPDNPFSEKLNLPEALSSELSDSQIEDLNNYFQTNQITEIL